MSKTIFITLNNSGNDPGPYIITLYTALGVATIWGTSPTKAQLTAGYQMIIPDNIVTVRVKSITCTSYTTLTVPIVPATTTTTSTTTTTTTTTTAAPTTTTTTTCNRPLKLMQFYLLHDIQLNSVWYNSEGQDKVYTCNLYSLIRDWAIPANSGMLQCEVLGGTGVVVGKTVYLGFNVGDCNKVPDGAYIYLNGINIFTTNPVTYCLANNPIQIITVTGGVITEISTCYYTPPIGDSNLVILNDTPTGTIESISPITYTPEIPGNVPVSPAAIAFDTHTGFTGALVVVVTDTQPGNISIYDNGVFVECINTSGTGTYTFSSHAWTSVEELRIVYSIGSCS
jgi:hypothetical protein